MRTAVLVTGSLIESRMENQSNANVTKIPFKLELIWFSLLIVHPESKRNGPFGFEAIKCINSRTWTNFDLKNQPKNSSNTSLSVSLWHCKLKIGNRFGGSRLRLFIRYLIEFIAMPNPYIIWMNSNTREVSRLDHDERGKERTIRATCVCPCLSDQVSPKPHNRNKSRLHFNRKCVCHMHRPRKNKKQTKWIRRRNTFEH